MTRRPRGPSKVEQLQRSSFARQADAYARSPSVTQTGLLEWLARLTEAAPGARVLDVACGTCHITISFARCGCLVTGVDLTLEMLHAGRRSLPPETRSRVQLLCGRAGSLPIPDGALDLCVCRSAFHHFAEPLDSLLEMKRVTRRGGRVATLDHVASEHAEEAAWHNRLERLRDPSHTACLSPSAWSGLYRRAGLSPDREEAATFEFDFDEWYERAFQSPATKAIMREELLGHPSGGVAGMRVHTREPLVLLFDFLALSAPVA